MARTEAYRRKLIAILQQQEREPPHPIVGRILVANDNQALVDVDGNVLVGR